MTRESAIANVILSAIHDGIYVVNQKYEIEFMNTAMIGIFGEGIGLKCHRVINSSDKKCPWCRAEQVFEGDRFDHEVYIPWLDKTFDVHDIPLDNQDGTVSKLSICRDISMRKSREQKLRAKEEDYQNLFEHVGCGVFISSKEGKFLNANHALLDMLGYDNKEEFLEIDLATDLWVRPDDRKRFQKLIEKEGRVIDHEVEFKRKDGSTIPVLLTGHVRYDQNGNIIGYEGLNQDISRRKAMEKQIIEAYDFLNKIVQSSPNAIMAADMDGNIIIWNQAAQELLGYSAAEVIGKMNIKRVYPEGTARKVMTMLRSNEHGGVGKLNTYPMVYVRRDKKIIEGTLSAAIIYNSEGKEIASIGSFVDLRDRLEMERELRRIQEQLLQSEKLAAMGRLTSQIAHELNNPLYGIMNTLELLKTEIPPQNKRRKILEMALSEITRLSELLRNMLSFSKPDQEEKTLVDINTIIEEILLLNTKQLQENDIIIATDLAAGMGKVRASKNQLRQVFLNLIKNAKDAMPEGGSIYFTTSVNAERVLIEVKDTGSGIRKEHISKIFDSFFTTKASVKGVGLGLSVCYGFIKEHGGDIRVESKPDFGTKFTITLPLAEAD